MKQLNYILNLAGFSGVNDYLGTFSFLLKPLAILSVTSASLVGFVETYSGVSFMLWVFLIFGTFFDLGLGWYANVSYLNQPFESHKFWRGLMKSFVTVCFIFLTNFLKLGVFDSEISLGWYKETLVFLSSIIHYSVVFLIGLYLLLGIAENLAKMEVSVAKSIVKILKMRINSIEDVASNKTE